MNKRKTVENFIRENTDSAYRFAFTYMKNRYDAEDVVQKSIVKALKNSSSLKNTDMVRTWFFKIISNTAISVLKKQNRIVPFGETEDEKGYIDIYNVSGLDEMIQKLPPKYTEIITLRYFEDMKIKDIAEILDLNENTVKTRLYRALGLLKGDMLNG